MTQDQLQAISAISGAFQALFGALVFLLGLVTVELAFRKRRAEVVARIREQFRSPGECANRRFVYNELSGDPSRATEEQRQRALSVAMGLEEIAYQVKLGLIDRKVIKELMADVYIRCWAKLKPYVLDDRKRRGEDPDHPHHLQHLDEFAQECFEYYRRKYPKHTLASK